jgi:hypothetical protein
VFAYLPALDADAAGYAVVTDRFLCLLGSETSAAATRELYVALDAGPVHIDDVLDALVARHGLEHFAIVEMLDAGERAMNVAVRGRVTVNLDGSTTTRLSGPTGATWITGEARGVSALTLALDGGEAATESFPIRRGVVRAQSVSIDQAVFEGAPPAFVDEPSPLTVPIDVPRIVEASRATAAAASASRAVKIDIDPAPRETPGLRVLLPDGNELDAATPILVGRRPWTSDFDTQSAVHVAVPSPLREVSGIHLELRESEGSLHARDLHSTNGTIVLTPAKPPRLLDGGRTTALVVGDVLDVGEGFQIVIVG